MQIRFVALSLIVVVFVVGCSTTSKVDISKLEEPPSTLEIASTHNERVEAIDTLWARISIRAKGVYPDGKKYEEQGEGHLQIEKPSGVSLTIRKLGELYFAYGANSESYWSFNLLDKEQKTMQIGRLEDVSVEKANQLGMPIHPGELIELSGLMPIDLSKAGGSRWSDDGKLVGVTVPSQWGSFVLWFDPRTNLVARSDVYDRDGVHVASASLTRYKPAKVPNQQPVLVPGKIEITNPGQEGFVRIEISEPASKTIRPMVFDPARLKRAYRVDEVIDLDVEFENREQTMDATP
ncbi:MAG: hypothetical protein P1U42_09525 [Phycisphaerales bacterium]|nr:hypothetical protein [Phycisphaerales bacterium]